MNPIIRNGTLPLLAALAGVTLLIGTANADDSKKYEPTFNSDGEMIRPAGWREWVYIGSPLTPHSLNGGKASFPEFHSVYLDPVSWEHWKKTGKFREGTMIAKELTLVGATAAPSGVGFFNGDLSGFEVSYKNSEKYPDEPGGWVYFSFGHQPEPYANKAPPQPTAACAACHTAAAADDMVFTQYYPIAVAAKGAGDDGAGVGGKDE